MIAGEDSLQRPDQDHIDNVKRTYTAQPTQPRGRLWPHPYLAEIGIYDPGPNFHEITTGLAGRSPRSPFGHDSSDAWAATKKILETAGLPEDWGTCKHCEGHGIDPEVKEAYDAWEDYDPPEGEGWQLWETVSEGSPITPVFATAEELAQCIADGGGRPLSSPPTYEEALAFVKGPGWAPSGVITAEHGFEGGLEHIARVAAEDKDGQGR
jgi:hypothetical protein